MEANSKLIVFVCNGNIERSVIAEACLKKILRERHLDGKYRVESFGLQGTFGTPEPIGRSLVDYPEEWAAAKPTLEILGIDISKHSFQKLTRRTVILADIIISMDRKCLTEACNALEHTYPEYARKFHLFSELSFRAEDTTDPFASNDPNLHRNLIEGIYYVLNDNLHVLREWLEN
jgi:protein-tyrosine-phosphatase